MLLVRLCTVDVPSFQSQPLAFPHLQHLLSIFCELSLQLALLCLPNFPSLETVEVATNPVLVFLFLSFLCELRLFCPCWPYSASPCNSREAIRIRSSALVGQEFRSCSLALLESGQVGIDRGLESDAGRICERVVCRVSCSIINITSYARLG